MYDRGLNIALERTLIEDRGSEIACLAFGIGYPGVGSRDSQWFDILMRMIGDSKLIVRETLALQT